MNDLAAEAVAWYAVAVALYAAWHTIKHTLFSNALFYAIAALEAALLILLVGSFFAIGDTDVDALLYYSYWAVTLVVAPVAVVWGIKEKSRWGTGVVVIGMWTVAVLLVRLQQIWHG